MAGWRTTRPGPEFDGYPLATATGLRLNRTWEVISAYRSAKTNEMLRNRSSAVASKSQHLLGKAIDVRLRGLDLKELHTSLKAYRRIDQLRLSLERLRWVRQEATDTMVVVNIAGFRALYFQDGEFAWETPVMVGKNYRQTPFLQGYLQT